MTNQIQIGRLLRASTSGCVMGCRITQIDVPALGGMVAIPIQTPKEQQIYGLIHEINIDDDGLVRQLITAESVRPNVIEDHRANRNVPVEISVIFIGYQEESKVWHLLPPRPPLTLDMIYQCENSEICAFTSSGRFGYLRHILNNRNLPTAELLAAHLRQANEAQTAGGNPLWAKEAVQELITLLRDDYATLMNVLSALGDTGIDF